MKITRGSFPGGHSERGFAVLVVIVLLVIMTSLAIGNNIALGHLYRELRLLDQRQQKRLAVGKATTTNAPPTKTVVPIPQPGAGVPGSAEQSAQK